MGGACGTYGRQERCIQGVAGKHEGRRAFGIRRRIEDDIKMDLQEMGWRITDWIGLAQR